MAEASGDGSASGSSSSTSGGASPGGSADAAVGADGGGSGSGVMVWITSTGSKYHCIPDCGNTKTSWQVTLDYAISQGYEACKRCW